MSKTIEGVPEFISHAQYLSLFEACGFDPSNVMEVRMAHDGVHALVFATWPDGSRRVERNASGEATGFYKHRVFIPVRREDGDKRTTRVSDVAQARPVRMRSRGDGKLVIDLEEARDDSK